MAEALACLENRTVQDQEQSLYWPLLERVMTYAVDDAPTSQLALGSEVVAEIQPDTFFDQLYVRRDDGEYEVRLAEHLLSSVPLLVLASGRGSGKTSAIRYACELIRRDARNAGVAVVVLDFKRLFSQFAGPKPDVTDTTDTLTRLIETQLRAHFFPTGSDTRDLVAWLVAGPPDAESDFDPVLVADLHDVASRVCNKAHADQPSRRSRIEHLKVWFASERDEFDAVYSAISPRLRATHIALAALDCRALHKIVLIYDNVDRLPVDYQHTLVTVANDTQLGMGAFCTSCVVMRIESLRSAQRADYRAGSLFKFMMPDELKYPGLLLPRGGIPHLLGVINQRYEFASALFRKHQPDDDHTEALQIVHRVVLSEFEDSSIHDLSNEDIRTVARLYVGFMQYLFTLSKARHVSLEELFGPERQQGFGHTLFYLWLGQLGEHYGFMLPDLLPPSRDGVRGAPHELMNVQYCILAVLHNLTQQARAEHAADFYAECRDVFAPILNLGFDIDAVREGVKKLISHRSEGVQLVEWLNDAADVRSLDVSSTDRLRLMPAGAVLLRDIMAKVGYVWRTALSQQTGNQLETDEYYLGFTVARRIKTMLAYLDRTLHAELLALSAVKAVWAPEYAEGWIERYRRLFGVDGKTVMERIVHGAARFYEPVFRSRDLQNVFTVLEAHYAKAVQALVDGREYDAALAAIEGQSDAAADELVALETDGPRWEHWLGWDTPKTSMIDALPRKGPGWPVLLLRRLRLRNIKCFEELDLDLTNADGTARACTALVGDNATGKTTILQAIALGILGPTGANQVAGPRALRYLRRGKKYGTIELELSFLEHPKKNMREATPLHVGLGIRATEEGFLSPSKDELSREMRNRADHLDALRRRVGYQWGLCCGYGAFRGIADTEQGASEDTSIAIERVQSLFQRFGTLIDQDILLRIWQDSQLASLSGTRGRIPMKIRDRILEKLTLLVPGLEVVRSGKKAHLQDRHGGIVDPTELSDGCNSMLALIGHLVRHSLEVYGCAEDPFKARGVVLIDEVDLHIHPAWQRRALPQIQEAFPELQFIVTTHSPLVVSGVADGRVTVLEKDDKGSIAAYSDAPSVLGWRVDQVLTGRLFDLSSAYGDDTERQWTDYARLLGELGEDHPKVRKIERELDRRKPRERGSTPADREAWRLMHEFIDSKVQALTEEEREQVLASLRFLFKS